MITIRQVKILINIISYLIVRFCLEVMENMQNKKVYKIGISNKVTLIIMRPPNQFIIDPDC